MNTSLHAMITSPLTLSFARAQFGFTIAFHIVLPAFSIGLICYLAVLEVLWLITGDDRYIAAFRYWQKIFAIIFTMGVVSGIVMEYEIVADWGGYSNKLGQILGPLFSYEVLTAFFLEAGFLGIMLFGMERVGKRLHAAATCMVAIGTLFSATWILAANSWMQTPRGYKIGPHGNFQPENWFKIIFNPTLPYEWFHMVFAAYISTAFMVGAVSGFHLLRNKTNPVTRLMFSMAMWMVVIVVPIQGFVGDSAGGQVWHAQPIKLAAMEGDFTTKPGQGLHLIGWPDRKASKLLYDVSIPHLGSVIVTHHWNGVIKGLDAFPKRNWPVLITTFWAFRIMVGLWAVMMAVAFFGLWLRFRGRLYETRWFQKITVLIAPIGFVTLVSGWVVTETGRQPWTAYGILRTSQSVSPLSLSEILLSFGIIIIVYSGIFTAGFWYVLKLMAREPRLDQPHVSEDTPQRAAGRHKLHSRPKQSSPAE
jgi:cytochrome d ubiquinol oxidase subunit I